jgi:hypothetical protein
VKSGAPEGKAVPASLVKPAYDKWDIFMVIYTFVTQIFHNGHIEIYH